MQPGTAILIVKSGISNHAASNILDDLCFSKFRTHLVESPNMERHRIRCPTRHGRNIRIFLQRIAAPGCILELYILQYSYHKTYHIKVQSMTTPFSGNKKRKRKRFLFRVGLLLLTVAVPRGIEPLFSPWEGDVLTAWPRNRTNAIITGFQKKATPFLKFF